MSTIGQPAVSTGCMQAMIWQARLYAQHARRTGSVLKERLATRRMDAMLDELAKRLGLAPTFAPNQQRDCMPDRLGAQGVRTMLHPEVTPDVPHSPGG